MEEQDNMQEEQQEQSLEKKIADTGKDIARNATKKAGDKVKKAVTKFMIANLPTIIAIIAIIIVATILVSGVLVIKDVIVDVATEISDTIMSFIEIGNTGPVVPNAKEMVELINQKLEELGIDSEELDMGSKSQRDAYLYKYMATSLSTKLPYIKDSTAKTLKEIALGSFIGGTFADTPKQDVQGIVKIRRQTGDNKQNLEFRKYENFKELIEDNDISALNYFSIDDSWMLCIAKYTTTTTTTGDSQTNTTTTVSEVKIPYQTMISRYNVPFEFFMALQQITLNPEYVSAVADLIQDRGEIELTIFDSTQIITNEYTYKYKVAKKWMQKVTIEKNPYDLETLLNEQEKNTKTGEENTIKIPINRAFDRTKIAKKRTEIIEPDLRIK